MKEEGKYLDTARYELAVREAERLLPRFPRRWMAAHGGLSAGNARDDAHKQFARYKKACKKLLKQ